MITIRSRILKCSLLRSGLILVLILLFNGIGVAQKSSVGRDFWVGYMSRDASQAPILSVTFSVVGSTGGGNVAITGPNLRREFEDLERGASVLFELDAAMIQQMMRLEEGSDNFALHISSDVDLMVYASNHTKDKPGGDDGDATLILPTDLLGTDYYALSYDEDVTSIGSEVVIVGTQNGTIIDIVPSVDTRNFRANELVQITLHAGQRYQLQSNGDLSGTRVSVNPENNSGCKPIAVFSGSLQTAIGPRTFPGHIYNQIFPLKVLGKSYSLVPFEKGINEYRVKVVTVEDNNEIFSNGVSVGTLANAGDYIELDYNDQRRITSTKPMLLAQFFKGFVEQEGKLVDPFMVVMTADEHMVSSGDIPETTFLGITGTIQGREFQSVLFQTSEVNQYVHESQNFTDEIMPFTPDQTLSFSNFYSDKVLTQTGNQGFAYYRYNFGIEDDVPNLGVVINTGFTELDTLSIEADPKACLGADFVVRPNFSGRDSPNPKYDTFEWDMGDGTVLNGAEVIHQYSQGGVYQVRLIASKQGGFCLEPDTVYHEVEVLDFKIQEFQGPGSVCPNTSGAVYSLTASDQNDFIWSVAGGTITSDNGDVITVDWGPENANASVTVVASNPFCDDDTIIYPVVISQNLEPETPIGPAGVCLNELEQTYFGSQVSGANYVWEIENGSILNGQGTSEVQVRWNGDAPGRIWYTQSQGSGANFCEGVSPELIVNIFPELLANTEVTHVSCNGNTDGSIILNPSGGNGPYEYSWSDVRLSGNQVEDLSPGSYEVVISDASGCSIIELIEITEPEVLSATLELVDVLCHGENNGTASVFTLGGTAPYQYQWDGGTLVEESTNSSLGVGAHTVRIVDANGCEFSLDFGLGQPEPLSAVTTDTPTCAGLSEGTISVEASGGVGPYTYRWNTSPPQDSQLITGLEAGKYSVTVTDANGCTFTFEDEEISEKYPVVRLPNVFSPNGDGLNDTFSGVSECSTDFSMKIYSQWGELLYYTTDLQKGWDGTHRGKEVPIGVYSYIVSYGAEVNGQPFREVVRGQLRIVR